MSRDRDNKIKEIILDRLFKTSSYCSFCGKKSCRHDGNRTLNEILKCSDVLEAINLDEHFYKENIE